MNKRRLVRELAMKVLFAWDAHGDADSAIADQIVTDSDQPAVRRDALAFAHAAWEQRAISDQRIEAVAPQWPIRRQPGVDRGILRLAVWELSNAPTPPRVVIDEAIELAKAFSTEQSGAFVNGVLDAIHKENRELVGNTEDASQETEDSRQKY